MAMNIILKCPVCHSEKIKKTDSEYICDNCKSDLTNYRLHKINAHHLLKAGNEKRLEGNFMEAILLLRDSMEIDASIIETRLLLGILYQHLNMQERANKILEPILYDPKYSDLINILLAKCD